MNMPLEKLSSSTPLARRWLPIFLLFIVHNLEEIALDLPSWGRVHISFVNGLEVGRTMFSGFVVGLCVVLFGVAFVYRKKWATTFKLMVIFLTVMLGVFVWHVGISLYTHSAQPGVVTAVLFMPFYAYWLLRLVRRIDDR